MARTGRPTKINDIVQTRPILDETGEPTGDVQEITVADQIIGDVRVGLYAERAARRAGIATSTFYDWEKLGRETRRRLERGEVNLSDLRVKERRCLEFSEAVDRAEVEFETRAQADLERLARGQIAIVETTTKVNDKGETVETRTKRSHTLPDPAVIQWRLERRFPEIYGRRTKIEGTGEDGSIPVEVRAANLGAALRSHLERIVPEDEDGDDG
jgi:hypothetical protein